MAHSSCFSIKNLLSRNSDDKSSRKESESWITNDDSKHINDIDSDLKLTSETIQNMYYRKLVATQFYYYQNFLLKNRELFDSRKNAEQSSHESDSNISKCGGHC